MSNQIENFGQLGSEKIQKSWVNMSFISHDLFRLEVSQSDLKDHEIFITFCFETSYLLALIGNFATLGIDHLHTIKLSKVSVIQVERGFIEALISIVNEKVKMFNILTCNDNIKNVGHIHSELLQVCCISSFEIVRIYEEICSNLQLYLPISSYLLALSPEKMEQKKSLMTSFHLQTESNLESMHAEMLTRCEGKDPQLLFHFMTQPMWCFIGSLTIQGIKSFMRIDLTNTTPYKIERSLIKLLIAEVAEKINENPELVGEEEHPHAGNIDPFQTVIINISSVTVVGLYLEILRNIENYFPIYSPIPSIATISLCDDDGAIILTYNDSTNLGLLF